MSALLTSADKYLVELVDGREVEKLLPKKLHIWIQKFLILALSRQLSDRFDALPECNVRTGKTASRWPQEYIIPDVAVTAVSARYEDGDLAEAPLLGVEILSPGQTVTELFARADRLIRLGCPTVWVIWPEQRRAWQLGPALVDETRAALSFRLPSSDSIEIDVPEMWSVLDRT